jgi:drug/metabolite transporter (DMT)-like permease
VVEIWSGIVLDGLGVAACFAAALSYALYILVAEHAVATRDPISLSCYGFLFASLFWAVVQPWWSFPAGVVARTTSLHGHLASLQLPVWALVAWLIVLGAIVPFALVVAALRHVSATRAGIAAMLEPPAATLVAFLWLGESLGLFQLLGGGLVLGAIALAQSSRYAAVPPLISPFWGMPNGLSVPQSARQCARPRRLPRFARQFSLRFG